MYLLQFAIRSPVSVCGHCAWDIADTLNGLMAIPNLIAVALLSPVVIKLAKEYFDEVKKNY
jgi:Na+/alanine symporter